MLHSTIETLSIETLSIETLSIETLDKLNAQRMLAVRTRRKP
jgi:hypothetical protein